MADWPRQPRMTDRGQALVETALALTLLLLIVGGIVEFGRILSTYLTVNNSAREGARIGAVGGTDADILAAVSRATSSLRPQATATITPAAAQRVRGEGVTVNVTCPLQLFFPGIAAILPNPYPVTAQIVMRVEG